MLLHLTYAMIGNTFVTCWFFKRNGSTVQRAEQPYSARLSFFFSFLPNVKLLFHLSIYFLVACLLTPFDEPGRPSIITRALFFSLDPRDPTQISRRLTADFLLARIGPLKLIS